jgi:predicted small secreted protein
MLSRQSKVMASPTLRGSRAFWAGILTILLLVSSFSVSSCNQLARFGIGVTSIATVTSNPANFPDVTVRGKVINQVGIFGQGAYELQDDTGTLWVFTQAGMPPLDTTLTVRGKASEGLTISGRNLGVTLTEKERL